jgi:alkanesulfonate monooxygenase SsuD/methylene tetrahydromethanopterin reductase-like flavin-dependent oxidoreductase (luciferase family)
MREITFGIFPSPAADHLETTLEAVRVAEEAGLDMVAIQDHPYQRRFLDTFTLLTTILARTDRIQVMPDVASLPMRGAAMTAKAPASLGIIHPGRFILGLGAGAFWEAVEGMGGPRRSPGEAVDAFIEAIEVIRLLWSGERGLRYDGAHYRLDGVHSGPVPQVTVPIWAGANGPRMLEVTGRLCDGWVGSAPNFPSERLGDAHARIDEAARSAGRDPDDIRRAYNIPASFDAGELERLALEHRIDTFILTLGDDPVAETAAFSELALTVRRRIA